MRVNSQTSRRSYEGAGTNDAFISLRNRVIPRPTKPNPPPPASVTTCMLRSISLFPLLLKFGKSNIQEIDHLGNWIFGKLNIWEIEHFGNWNLGNWSLGNWSSGNWNLGNRIRDFIASKYIRCKNQFVRISTLWARSTRFWMKIACDIVCQFRQNRTRYRMPDLGKK